MSHHVDLDVVLGACLNADNQVRKQAEDALKQLSQHPDIVPELVKRLQASQEPQTRQLAAVLLRKHVGRHWAKLSQEVQNGTQALLLQQLANEAVHLVQHAVADAVGAVAKLSLPQQQWPELPGFLQQCSQSSSSAARETALLLFASLADSIGQDVRPYVSSIQGAILAGLSDSHQRVQLAALAALEPLLVLASSSRSSMPGAQQLLAGALQLGQHALQHRHDEVLVRVLELLMDAAEVSGGLMQQGLPAALGLAMAVAGEEGLDTDSRKQALELLQWLARFKPKSLVKQGPLLKQAITGVCHLMCRRLSDEDDGDDDEVALRTVAAQALDALSVYLPSNHVMPAAWAFVGSAAASPHASDRAAAMAALARMSEGCAEPLRKRLKDVLPLVLAGLRDQAGEVRGAAAAALSEFADYLQPDISERYEQVLPAVFQLLGDADQGVQRRALHALEAFCEALEGSEIKPYVPQLMQALLSLVQHSTPAMQERALGCMSSVIIAAGRSIEPFAVATMPILQGFLQQSGREHLGCRCRATECVGVMADALGPEDPVLQQALPHLLELTLQGFALDSNELREYSHACLYHSARALGPAFVPWLPRAVQLAIASCQQDDGAAFSAGEDTDDEGEMEHGDEPQQQLRIRTGVLDEKAAATCALGTYAQATGSAFMPYIEQVLEVLCEQADYFHEEVRANAYEALQRVALAVHAHFPPSQQQQQPRQDTAGHAGPSSAGSGVSHQTRHVLDQALVFLLRAARTDPEKTAATAALAGLAALLKGMGAAVLGDEDMEAACSAVQSVLAGEAACQAYADDEDDDDDEGPDDAVDAGQEDEDLMTGASELMAALAHAMEPSAFAAAFQAQLLPALLSRLGPKQPDAIRGTAMGAAAEVCEATGAAVAAAVPRLLPAVLAEMRAEDACNRQNAAFCSGMLAQCAPQHVASHALQLLQALAPLFAAGEQPGARDNAVGAVGRLVLALGAALPLEQVVPTFVDALPLQEDLGETLPACQALAHLLTSADLAPRIASCVPRIVSAFGKVAAQEAAPPEARALVARTLAGLQAQYPQQMAGLLAGLPADQQAALQQQLMGAG